MSETTAPEFSYIIEAQRVGATGMEFDISPTPEEKEALAERFNLVSLQDFSAHILLNRINKTRLRLKADFVATIEQECVVSLTPFTAKVKDSFSLTLIQGKDETLNLNEIDVDMQENEEEEYLESDKIDVADFVLQYFSLALDPFPHSPEARFEEQKTDEIKENPFLALKKLNFS